MSLIIIKIIIIIIYAQSDSPVNFVLVVLITYFNIHSFKQ